MESISQNGYRRHGLTKENLEASRENAIKVALIELNLCKESITELKEEDISSMSKPELFSHDRKLDLQVRKRKVILQKLLKLGYNADKRGRPKKEEHEKYKFNHVRMACYFTEDNAALLKKLKEQGAIENISSFINDLIQIYVSEEMNTAKK